jgi:hypothetical protein
MIGKQRIAPLALMFVAAGLSFLVCEELSKVKPSDQQKDALAQSISRAQTPVATEMSKGQPQNFAQRIVQKINHAVHSSAGSAELMETSSTQRESGLQTVQPESVSPNESGDESGDIASAHGPLDLSLVPGVIVLPKAEEPLASAGLYDKRTRQKL